MDNKGYLLLVEDEPAVQANNKTILGQRGYKIKQAYSLAEARAFFNEELPAAIVLDIQLPDGNGLDFLKEIRITSNVPVLMLTAMRTHEDVIKGLEAGGDNYLTKPYKLGVFISYVEAMLLRASLIPDILTIGPLTLEPASGRALLHGEDMVLTQKEYALLQQFVQRPEKTLTAEYLYEKVWCQEMAGDDSAFRSAIKRLRKKLQNSGFMISSEYGEGYMLERE